jgi:DNA repair protein RadC
MATGEEFSMETYHGIIRDLPAAERPRERLAKNGAEVLANAELLAILLRTGSAKESALGLANRLLSHFGGLSGIAGATVEQLSALSGLGLAKAAQLKAAFELGKRLAVYNEDPRPAITSPAEAAGLVMEILCHEQKEHFLALLLDTRNRVIAQETISVGSLQANIVHPREVFKVAIARSAAALIVLHNHPSGDPSPSEEDRAITARLVEAGALIGIPVLDHIIIGAGRFVSLKEQGGIRGPGR